MTKKQPSKKPATKPSGAKKPAAAPRSTAGAGGPPSKPKTGTPAAGGARASGGAGATGAAGKKAGPPVKPAPASTGSGPKPKSKSGKSSLPREYEIELPAVPKKSPYSKGEQKHYEELLLTKRDALVGDLRSLEKQAFRASEQDSSANHMADYGSDNYEQDFNLGLIENEEEVVLQIDEALKRIEENSYGACLDCGIAIPKARLEILPWTPYCVNCQAKVERF